MLIDRYRSAGITSIAHDFYPGGRHEMLHELNRREVLTNLLVWISALLHGRASTSSPKIAECAGPARLDILQLSLPMA